MCSKQNLNHFEMQSRKNQPNHGANNNNNNSNGNNIGNGPPHGMRNQMYDGNPGGPGGIGRNPMMNNNGGGNGNMRPPLMNRPQRSNGPLLSNQPQNMGMGRGPSNYGPNSGGGGHGGVSMQSGGGNQGWQPHQMGGGGPGSGGPGNGGQRGLPMHNVNPRTGGPMGGPMGMRLGPGPNGPRNNQGPLLRAPGPPNDGRIGHGAQMNDWDSHGMQTSMGNNQLFYDQGALQTLHVL
jgi:hypothetical protein